MNNEDFELYLRQGNMAENTINAYLYAIKEYYSRHRELNKRNLLIYKTYLIETFKPKTVNLRIQAMNKYLECIKKPRLRLKSVKVQQRSYLENVISNADYIFLKNNNNTMSQAELERIVNRYLIPYGYQPVFVYGTTPVNTSTTPSEFTPYMIVTPNTIIINSVGDKALVDLKTNINAIKIE